MLLDSASAYGLDRTAYGELSTHELQDALRRERENYRLLLVAAQNEGHHDKAEAIQRCIDRDLNGNNHMNYLEHAEDSSLSEYVNRTGEECARCGDHIGFTDEVFLMTVVSATVDISGLVYMPLASEDGDFLYEPRLFDLYCWEDVHENLQRAKEDVPPLLEPRSIIDCSVCESGIMQGESLALIAFGEIHCSNRCPNRKTTNTFASYDKEPLHICLSCLRYLHDNECSMWEGEVQQDDECVDGTYSRCWRYGCPGQRYGCMKYW